MLYFSVAITLVFGGSPHLTHGPAPVSLAQCMTELQRVKADSNLVGVACVTPDALAKLKGAL